MMKDLNKSMFFFFNFFESFFKKSKKNQKKNLIIFFSYQKSNKNGNPAYEQEFANALNRILSDLDKKFVSLLKIFLKKN